MKLRSPQFFNRFRHLLLDSTSRQIHLANPLLDCLLLSLPLRSGRIMAVEAKNPSVFQRATSECQLPKLDVAGSIPVSRSIESTTWELSRLSGLVRLVR